MRKSSKTKPPPSSKKLGLSVSTYLNANFAKRLILTTDFLLPVSVLLVLADGLLSILIVQWAKYTEIDWIAYMQEVEGFLNGTTNYSQLQGDTGPLVYPAGFVYIYSGLYWLTDGGSNIRMGQFVFVGLYVVMLALVFWIYVRTKKVPAYVLCIMSFTTYRVHSIFMLRLFNDPFAMVFLYAALNAFLDSRWTLGSVLFSLAVSIKMNILLFAPSLLIAYLTSLTIPEAIVQMTICASVQLILGLPFLIDSPVAYIKGAFNVGRVFEHKWTVNWRFLPEKFFVHPYFHLFLLGVHIAVLVAFSPIFIKYLQSFSRLKAIETDIKRQASKNKTKVDMSSLAQLFILPFFITNFVGITFSRSLHYQFYVWYYHTLPYLLWSTDLSDKMRLTLLGLIELCWNTYPSSDFSSALLHSCHLIILANLYRTCTGRIKCSK